MAFSETFKAFHNTVASWEHSVGNLLNSVCWVLLCVFHFRRLSPWFIWSCWTLSSKVSETFIIIRICSFKNSQILSDVPFFSENFFQGTVCVSLGMMWCWVHSGHFCLLFAWVFCSVSHWWLCKVRVFHSYCRWATAFLEFPERRRCRQRSDSLHSPGKHLLGPDHCMETPTRQTP